MKLNAHIFFWALCFLTGINLKAGETPNERFLISINFVPATSSIIKGVPLNAISGENFNGKLVTTYFDLALKIRIWRSLRLKASWSYGDIGEQLLEFQEDIDDDGTINKFSIVNSGRHKIIKTELTTRVLQGPKGLGSWLDLGFGERYSYLHRGFYFAQSNPLPWIANDKKNFGHQITSTNEVYLSCTGQWSFAQKWGLGLLLEASPYVFAITDKKDWAYGNGLDTSDGFRIENELVLIWAPTNSIWKLTAGYFVDLTSIKATKNNPTMDLMRSGPVIKTYWTF